MDAIERLRRFAHTAPQSAYGLYPHERDAILAHIDALTDALHDAVNRPKGVVPKSAEPFYNQMRAE
jgi:hypothetical protein